jgi:hypothetical protein
MRASPLFPAFTGTIGIGSDSRRRGRAPSACERRASSEPSRPDLGAVGESSQLRAVAGALLSCGLIVPVFLVIIVPRPRRSVLRLGLAGRGKVGTLTSSVQPPSSLTAPFGQPLPSTRWTSAGMHAPTALNRPWCPRVPMALESQTVSLAGSVAKTRHAPPNASRRSLRSFMTAELQRISGPGTRFVRRMGSLCCSHCRRTLQMRWRVRGHVAGHRGRACRASQRVLAWRGAAGASPVHFT